MKIVFITFLLFSFLHADYILDTDSMKRIEFIVKDITKLRSDYEKCKEKLKDKKITKISTETSVCKQANEEAKKYKKLYEAQKHKNKILKAQLSEIRASEVEKIIKFKAATFRLNDDSIVYDSINGNKVDIWKKGACFTSNKKTNNWILVTGYFVNYKWQSSKKKMWIKITQTLRK